MRSILTPLLLILATPALATDGVLEINQACAVQTGCFAGDTAGLPVTITTSGSYRLTSSLTLPDENTTGIDIQAAHVDLDLGGFLIAGPVTCGTSGDPPRTTCSATGTGWGIFNAEPYIGARVHDGTVAGAGFFGAGVASLGSIENVKVIDNGGGGLFASGGVSIVSAAASRNGGNGVEGVNDVEVIATVATDNRDRGVSLGEGADIRGARARRNFDDGIFTLGNATVSDSSSSHNGDEGFRLANGSSVSGCTASSNGGVGILAGSGSAVSNNAVDLNGSHGIQSFGSSSVTGNSVTSNAGSGSGYGLSLGASGYRGNVVTNAETANSGTVEGGIDAGGNVCNDSLTCP